MTLPSLPRRGCLAALVALAAATAAPVFAQDWPTKPVKFINNFPPGGPSDLIARSVTLQGKVRRLDASIHSPLTEHPTIIGNPLAPQLNRLRAAFERQTG